jgi:hypothetical protein
LCKRRGLIVVRGAVDDYEGVKRYKDKIINSCVFKRDKVMTQRPGKRLGDTGEQQLLHSTFVLATGTGVRDLLAISTTAGITAI